MTTQSKKSEYLYLTADRVGMQSGGGIVTYQESRALAELASEDGTDFNLVDRKRIEGLPESSGLGDPWCWDHKAYYSFGNRVKLAHLYAGTFSDSVAKLKSFGAKVTYTAAAHDINESRKAHLELGISYDYPHLTDPDLWRRYVGGYLGADVVVCPSTLSANVMRSFGAKRVEVIPHGCYLPEGKLEFPTQFVVGYLGSLGADKGVRYLLEAWKNLAYKDAILVLGGSDSQTPWADYLIRTYGGGTIVQLGWVKDVSDFYNGISLYVQPSVSEGFGIEVLEAMAYGRNVLCSTGAGACDLIVPEYQFPSGAINTLAKKIDQQKLDFGTREAMEDSKHVRDRASAFTWDKIRARYQDLWRSLLS